MKKEPYWNKNKNLWICPNHIATPYMSRYQHTCMYSSCSSTKPQDEDKQPRIIPKKKKDTIQEKDTCTWFKCENKRKENSIYCSIDCKNKNARHNYRIRQKKKKNNL